MNHFIRTLVAFSSAFLLLFSAATSAPATADEASQKKTTFPVTKTEAEWKKLLTPEQYHIMREEGTERPFTGQYDRFYQPGIYRCAACGNLLFKSDTKFDAGEGSAELLGALDSNIHNQKVRQQHVNATH